MTKDEKEIVAMMPGYIIAKMESGKDEVLPAHQIKALFLAQTALEREIYNLEIEVMQAHDWNTKESKVTDAERKKNFELMKLNQSLANKLREKTYPIGREYNQKIHYLNALKIINKLKDKVGLQIMEIGKLQGLLKEADDKIETLEKEKVSIETESHKNLRLLWKRDEEIKELKQTLEMVRMEVVEQTARDNEKKLKGESNGKK